MSSADPEEDEDTEEQVLVSCTAGADGTLACGVQISQNLEIEGEEAPVDGSGIASGVLQAAGKTVEGAGYVAGKLVEAVGRALGPSDRQGENDD